MYSIPTIKWTTQSTTMYTFSSFRVHVSEDLQVKLVAKLSQLPLCPNAETVLTLELTETVKYSKEEFSMTVNQHDIHIQSPTPTGLQHGISTLKLLLYTGGQQLHGGQIFEYPEFKHRGLFLDVSRGKMPTIAYLQDLVSLIADLKFNSLQLYFEDKFHLDSDPTIGELTGAYTEQEIRDLDHWCAVNHIELQPCIQTFSHMHGILTLPNYHHLAENENLFSLAAGKEDVYHFIDRVLSQTLTWFSSSTININMDEAYDVGTGFSKQLVESQGKGQVYFDHINRVASIARSYGVKKIIIWGDIALRYKELLKKLPPDIIVSDWNYNPLKEFPSLATLEDSGVTYWAAGGVSTWNSLFPRVYNTYTNLIHYSVASKRQGAEGFLVTDWGDYGHFQSLGLSLYGYLIGSQQSYRPRLIDPVEIEENAWALMFPDQRIQRAFRLLMDTNLAPNVQTDFKSMSIYYFFDDLFDGLAMNGNTRYPKLYKESFEVLYKNGKEAEILLREVLVDMEKSSLSYPDAVWARLFGKDFLQELLFSARTTKFTGAKGLLSLQIKENFATKNVAAQDILQFIIDVKKLYSEFLLLRNEFETIWTLRAHRQGIESTLLIFDKASIQFGKAVQWLSDQYRSARIQGDFDHQFQTYRGGKDYKILWTTDYKKMWERAYPWQ